MSAAPRRTPALPATASFTDDLRDWASLWNAPALTERVTISFSARLTRSLGRCHPRQGTIRLAAWLCDADPALLREVLCHEVAHVAAWDLTGGRNRPHGAEWRALMRAAGYQPRVRYPQELLPPEARKPSRRSSLWDHSCPRCGAHRTARRVMRIWRCARCVEAGREGRLVIHRSGDLLRREIGNNQDH